jgi:hypothetical protein
MFAVASAEYWLASRFRTTLRTAFLGSHTPNSCLALFPRLQLVRVAICKSRVRLASESTSGIREESNATIMGFLCNTTWHRSTLAYYAQSYIRGLVGVAATAAVS